MEMLLMVWWVIFAGLLVIFLAGLVRTNSVQKSQNQILFLRGKIPEKLPNGFYRGHAASYTGPWQGKSFDAEKNMGINIFKGSDRELKKFPFKTYVGKGLQDKTLDVIKIDYDVLGNSFWVRIILDEIVEVEKGEFLGKIHLRFLPGIPFTVGYFTLER